MADIQIPKNAKCQDCSWYDHCQSKKSVKPTTRACENFESRYDSTLSLEEERDIRRTLDIDAELEKVIASGFDLNAFNIIDDRDFPCAKNIAEYAMSQNFCNMKPYAVQLSMMLNLFNDYCPFCSDTEMANNPPVDMEPENMVDRLVLYEYGVCPKCGKSRLDAIRAGKTKDYQELAACIGQRAGKSIIGSLMASYMLHRYIKLFPTPMKFLGLDSATVLTFTFCALSSDQAQANVWEPFKGFISQNKWFTQYHDFLKEKEKELGTPILWNKQTFMYYGNKRLSMKFCGPDKRVLRGATRFGYVIDEIGWFSSNDTSGIKYNADEVNQALANSCQTVRAAARRLRKKDVIDIPHAMSFMISSPSSASDKIMRLVREADDVDNRYAIHKATWEVNPDFPREHFDNDFKVAPLRTMRDFGAVPPLSDNPFIEDWKALSASCVKPKEECLSSWLKFQKCTDIDNWGSETQFLKLNYSKVDKGIPRIMAVDAGFTYNAFAFLVGHLEPGKDADAPFFHIDLACECRPGIDHIPVNFPMLFENCLLKLADVLNIAYVVFDRWNSIDPMQRFKQKGIRAAQYSVTYQDFFNMKHHISAGHYLFPKVECPFEDILNLKEQYEAFVVGRPTAHLMLQLLTIKQVGKQITKGGAGSEGFDDDMARCLCLASSYAYNKQYMRLFLSKGNANSGQKLNPEAMGSIVQRSMGSFNPQLKPGGPRKSGHVTCLSRSIGNFRR